MPEQCKDKGCLECDSHAIVGGKLDCNYMNRLGIAQVSVKNFMAPKEEPKKQTQALFDEEIPKELQGNPQEEIDKEMAELEKKRQELLARKGGATNVS
jgi:hypothetical protein